MPYIAVTTSKALSDEQKDELKKTIGQKISLIPGKTEAALMVDISDNHTMAPAVPGRHLQKDAERVLGVFLGFGGRIANV